MIQTVKSISSFLHQMASLLSCWLYPLKPIAFPFVGQSLTAVSVLGMATADAMNSAATEAAANGIPVFQSLQSGNINKGETRNICISAAKYHVWPRHC